MLNEVFKFISMLPILSVVKFFDKATRLDFAHETLVYELFWIHSFGFGFFDGDEIQSGLERLGRRSRHLVVILIRPINCKKLPDNYWQPT